MTIFFSWHTSLYHMPCPVGHSSGWKMAAFASWTSSTGAIWWTYTSWISTCKHVIWSVSKHCRFVAPFIVQHISAARYSLYVPTPSVRFQLYFATANWFHLTIMEKMTRLQALTFRAPFHHRGLARCRIGWSQDSQSFHILPAKMISSRIDFAAVRPSQLVLLSKSFLNGTKSGRLSRLLKSATQWGARCDYTYIDHLWILASQDHPSSMWEVNLLSVWSMRRSFECGTTVRVIWHTSSAALCNWTEQSHLMPPVGDYWARQRKNTSWGWSSKQRPYHTMPVGSWSSNMAPIWLQIA